MKTKIIPFDLEIAKKIQAGEIEGKIKTRDHKDVDEIVFLETPLEFKVCAVINGMPHSFTERGFERSWDKSGSWEGDLVLEVPEEAPEEQHPIGESELYQAGYKAGFEAGRCVAFDEKKGCVIKKEASKYDDVEEVPTGDGSIVFLRHKKHEFKPFEKVLVREDDLTPWQAAFFSHIESFEDGERFAITTSGDNYNLANNEIIPYEGNEHLIGTTDNPKELC